LHIDIPFVRYNLSFSSPIPKLPINLYPVRDGHKNSSEGWWEPGSELQLDQLNGQIVGLGLRSQVFIGPVDGVGRVPLDSDGSPMGAAT
jgi:hypothetical protein